MPMFDIIRNEVKFYIAGVMRRYDLYEYGVCNRLRARRNRITGDVQFVLWKAGQQGHKKDLWINFDKSWYEQFRKENGA